MLKGKCIGVGRRMKLRFGEDRAGIDCRVKGSGNGRRGEV